MNWHFDTYSTSMFIITALMFIIAGMIWSRRQSAGSVPMTFLMIAVGWWALTAGLDSAAPTQQLKILWSKIEYLGITPSPVFLFLFILQYTHHEGWLNRRRNAPTSSAICRIFGVKLGIPPLCLHNARYPVYPIPTSDSTSPARLIERIAVWILHIGAIC